MLTEQEIRVINVIQGLETPTRFAIAEGVGLSKVTVTAVLGSLKAKGFVEAAGKTRNEVGRPSVIYRVAPAAGCAVGVYIEGGVCSLVAVDAAGTTLSETSVDLRLSARPGDHVKEIVEQVTWEVQALLGSPTVKGRRILAIGVAPPGMVDTGRRVWLHGLRLSGIEHIDLGAKLEQSLGRAVLVEDPTRCLTHLAAVAMGREEAGNLLLLYLGDGVGAGLVLDGRIYRGHRGLAGEIGHLVVEEHGERCACGNAGCLETVASTPGILGRFQRRLRAGVISSLQACFGEGDQCPTLEDIATAAAAGDRLALTVLAETGAAIGDACSTSIMLLNPRTLRITGPVAALGEFFGEALRARIKHRVFPEMLADVSLEIVPPRTGDEARGAALLAARWFWERLAAEDTASGRASLLSAAGFDGTGAGASPLPGAP